MKTDTLFPPPPQFNQPPLRCDDIPPARQRALHRLSDFAAVAESLIGTIQEGAELPYPGTARGFALHVFSTSPFAEEIAELLSRSKINIIANDHVDAPHVMIIDPRRYWGVLGPIRGDITLFADGHAAVVTKPLCMGCQHFEAVSFVSTDGPPQIAKLTHWLSTVRWIVRLMDERENEPSSLAEASSEAGSPPAAEAPPVDAPPAEPKRKRKITGLA
jgi:hypothetical protein